MYQVEYSISKKEYISYIKFSGFIDYVLIVCMSVVGILLINDIVHNVKELNTSLISTANSVFYINDRQIQNIGQNICIVIFLLIVIAVRNIVLVYTRLRKEYINHSEIFQNISFQYDNTTIISITGGVKIECEWKDIVKFIKTNKVVILKLKNSSFIIIPIASINESLANVLKYQLAFEF